MESTITLYGQGNEQQEVKIAYKAKTIGWWVDPDEIHVTELTILTPLSITPSDLHEDLQVGIATALWIDYADKVKIKCQPILKRSKFQVLHDQVVHLFI